MVAGWSDSDARYDLSDNRVKASFMGPDSRVKADVPPRCDCGNVVWLSEVGTVSDQGFPRVFSLGVIQTEEDQGREVWRVRVDGVTYLCETGDEIRTRQGAVSQAIRLRYTRSRHRWRIAPVVCTTTIFGVSIDYVCGLTWTRWSAWDRTDIPTPDEQLLGGLTPCYATIVGGQ